MEKSNNMLSMKCGKVDPQSKAKKKYFGNVEYLEDDYGHVVEIKASDGVFVIKKHSLSYPQNNPSK